MQQIQNRQRVYFVFVVSVLLAMFGAYVYFVSASVVHVVIRKEINQEIGQLHSEISALETDYISAQHALSSDIATREGFVETGKKIFIDRTTANLVLSDNDES